MYVDLTEPERELVYAALLHVRSRCAEDLHVQQRTGAAAFALRWTSQQLSIVAKKFEPPPEVEAKFAPTSDALMKAEDEVWPKSGLPLGVEKVIEKMKKEMKD